LSEGPLAADVADTSLPAFIDATMHSDFPTRPNQAQVRLREQFDSLAELPEAERAAWLDANVTDADERAALLRLLAADTGKGFLDTPAGEHAVRLAPEDIAKPEGLIGQQIGEFRILRALGQGGMAAVFLGERSGKDFRQQAAVKLLRRGLYSELEQRLFLRERRVLAALDHANIARLIDGGVTRAGIPYLVMEYVDGVPITRYAQTHAVDVHARLALFLTVCRAVAAAHRSLIVHRDIKPSNILVSNDGVVKLLDFGIAKLIEDDGDDATGTVGVFTPGYAAPEQISGGAITTATDVYGLGVLLHELLLGVRPEGTPTRRPSSLISTRRDEITVTDADSVVYPIAPARLRKLLRGDLDNILLKALHPEPALRYATANSLGDDIERHMRRQPVVAHPPSRLYRARKFVQRHRGGVTLTIVFLLGILSALGLALWQSQVAREQARLAHSQAQRANATRDFMVDLLKTASADLPKDQRPTPAALVSEAAKSARQDPDLDASVRAQLLLTLGEIARSNGDYAHAESLIDEAIQRQRDLQMPSSSPEWIDTLVEKGNLLHVTNRNNEADRLMEGILPELLATDSDAAVSGLMLYGATRAYAGDAAKAVSIAQQALRKAQRVFGADSINGIETQSYLGQLCANVHRYREAAQMLDEAITRWRALHLPEDEDFARTLFHLASAREHLGEHVGVEALYREGIALMRRVFDGPHDRIADGLNGLAGFLITQDRFDDAQAALDEALAIDRKLIGTENSKTAVVLENLSVLDGARHRDAAAEQSARDALAVLAAHAQASGFEEELAMTRLHLAETLVRLDRADEAASQLAQAAAQLPALFGAGSAQVADGMRIGGLIALSRHDAGAALDAGDRALAMLARLDPKSPRVEISSRRLRARALEALGRRDEALAETTHALDALRATNPDAHAQQTALLALHARIQLALGQREAAAATILTARSLGVPSSVLATADAQTLQASSP
jgi:eukaryotic-like serine/threonine-protein kinase